MEGFFCSWQYLIEDSLSERCYFEQLPVARLVELSRQLRRIDPSLRRLPLVFEEPALRLHRSRGQGARLGFSLIRTPWRHPVMTHPEKWQVPMPGWLGRSCHLVRPSKFLSD